MNPKPFLVWTVVICLLAVSGAIFSKTYFDLLAEGRRPLEVILPVRLGQEARVPTEQAVVQSQRYIVLAFGSGGIVEDIPVHPGHTVDEGDIIATLKHETTLIAKEEAELALRSSQVGPRSLQQKAELQLRRAHLAVEDAFLRAPFAGTIGDVSVSENEFTAPGQAVATLMNGVFAIEAYISEVDVNRLSIGNKVELQFDSLQEGAPTGVLSAISPEVEAQGKSRRVKVTIDIPVVEGLRHGMSAKAYILVPRPAWALDLASWIIAALFLMMLIATYLVSRLTVPKVD